MAMKASIIDNRKKTVTIDGNSLTIEAVELVAKNGYTVMLSKEAEDKIKKTRSILRNKIKSGETIYGVNTGFGFLSNQKIDSKKLKQLQVNLIRSHASGVGEFITEEKVRAIMLLRANVLAREFSGVRPAIVKKILQLLNNHVHPCIPGKGSVGASGDLAPLAHLALVLIGEGEAKYRKKILSGKAALSASKITPLTLEEKEGLALINGTQVSTGMGIIHFINARNLVELADLAGAMTIEALRGSHGAFAKEIHEARPHPGQIQTAENLRGLLHGSEIAKSHKKCIRVQDAYSLRCIPQVHGAVRDVLEYVRKVLSIEINSSTDNPLVFPSTGKILSNGNFHAEPIAFAMDFLGIAVSELANISERRIDKLMNPALSGHPPFLVKDSGLNSGLMAVQIAAAALVSENKALSTPASVDSIPTSADKEDHVSMSAYAAAKLKGILDNTGDVICMELLCAYQGLSLLLPLKPSIAVLRAYNIIKEVVAPIKKDRAFYKDIRVIRELINSDLIIKNIRVQSKR